MARKNGNETMRLQAPHWEQDEYDTNGTLIKEGEWVEVLKYESHGVKRAVQARMAKFIEIENVDFATLQKNKDTDPLSQAKLNLNMQAMMEEGNDGKLLAMLKDWNFKDKNGVTLPLNQQGIDALMDEDVQFILDAIDMYNPDTVTQEDKDAFLQTPSAGSEVSTTTSTAHLGG